MILRLDSGNDVRKWEQRLAGKDKPGRNIMNPHVELRWMGNTEKLHVIAHSSDDFLSLENFYSPIELARKLINMGLPLNYRGQIVLHGCRSGLGGEDSFATKLQDALVDYGRRVPVKANIGTSKVLEDGSTRVMRVEDYYKYKALGDKLEKRWRSDLANEDKMLDYDLDHLDVPDAPTYQQHLQQQYGKTGKKLINKYFTRDYDRKQRLNRPDWSLRSAWGYTKGLASRAWDVIDGMSS
ncbi:MAG TPA: hypothetical protein VFI24_20830 [Pyrinomonadaceae bacterium]|nr:hypothetical protein [Pyrinomonadaceae bacterium]